MTGVRRRRRRPAFLRPGRRLPALDADLHAYVIARLDVHLTRVEAARRDLLRPCTTGPGGRRQAAAAVMVEARELAHDIAMALGETTPGGAGSGGPDAPPGDHGMGSVARGGRRRLATARTGER